MNNKLIKGILLVAIGASSYGILATLVKKGVEAGYTTAELTFSQTLVGVITLLLLNWGFRQVSPSAARGVNMTQKDKLKLMIGGVPLGLTSTFYYVSLLYLPVSVCIVMLMQSVWIGVIADLLVNKVKPSPTKLVSIAIVLVGTILATNVLNADVALDWRGILWGFLAAISYSLTFLASNNIAQGHHPIVRSLYMLLGSLVIVSIVWGYALVQKFDPGVIWAWGIVLALFGTVLPPLLFTKGMPLVGVGLGGIIASIELPVSVAMAYLFINETVDPIQWIGIVLILLAIALMNISLPKVLKFK